MIGYGTRKNYFEIPTFPPIDGGKSRVGKFKVLLQDVFVVFIFSYEFSHFKSHTPIYDITLDPSINQVVSTTEVLNIRHFCLQIFTNNYYFQSLPWNVNFRSTFSKQGTFIDMIWRCSTARLTHGPMTTRAFINPWHFAKTSQT